MIIKLIIDEILNVKYGKSYFISLLICSLVVTSFYNVEHLQSENYIKEIINHGLFILPIHFITTVILNHIIKNKAKKEIIIEGVDFDNNSNLDIDYYIKREINRRSLKLVLFIVTTSFYSTAYISKIYTDKNTAITNITILFIAIAYIIIVFILFVIFKNTLNSL